MTDELTDDQLAVRDALIESDASQAELGVPTDEQAVSIAIGEHQAYFAPFEVREFSMSVAREQDGNLNEVQMKVIDHAFECAEVVAGVQSLDDAAANADSDVEVAFPE